jgi:hypothetical protein
MEGNKSGITLVTELRSWQRFLTPTARSLQTVLIEYNRPFGVPVTAGFRDLFPRQRLAVPHPARLHS